MHGRLTDLLARGVTTKQQLHIWSTRPDPAAERTTSRPSTLRIAYLVPASWTAAAEAQGLRSLMLAGETVGVEVVRAASSDELEALSPDFVIAIASSQPKTTSFPTFLAVHEPRSHYFQEERYFQNLLSYDGFLTISPTLARFVRQLCAGFGRECVLGEYFNTSQIQPAELTAPVARLGRTGSAQLCYFGTNWDQRSRPLFRALAKRPYTRIYGPEKSWTYLADTDAYRGSLPFDGNACQREYARHGVGLVVQSRNHVADDVISNRLFEIAAVGAAAICPDMPWIRENFGDNVYYYPAFAEVDDIVRSIDAAMAHIANEPEEAQRRAGNVRRVFEDRYSMEEMLRRTIDCFERWQAGPGRGERVSEQPLIDVIVRVGGRDIDTIRRAVASIDGQLAGRFRIIFVRYRPLDLAPIQETRWQRIEQIEIVDAVGGNRSRTMSAGLRAVKGHYFAVLDDDDFWLSNHVANLLRTARPLPADRTYVYSGTLRVDGQQVDASSTQPERRSIAQCTPARGTLLDILGRLSSNCFLASARLLDSIDLDDWELESAEDSLLHISLIARAETAFTWSATACFTTGTGQASDFIGRSSRQEDVFEAFLRGGGGLEDVERRFAGSSTSTFETLAQALREVFDAKSRAALTGDLVVWEEGTLGTALDKRDNVERRELVLHDQRISLAGGSSAVSQGDDRLIEILPAGQPWAFGAVIVIAGEELFDGPQSIVLEFDALPHSYGVGVLAEGADFMIRVEAPGTDARKQIWLNVIGAQEPLRVVVQNWGQPSTRPAILRRAWLVRDVTA